MKSKIKKLKKKAQAQLKKMSASLSKLTSKALRALKLLGVALLSGLAIISTVLVADMSHKRYLEHVIGDQILFVSNMPDSKVHGSATGFHVKTPNNKIVFLTNAHVCQLANANGIIAVHDKLHSGRLIPRRVLEVYKNNDLCVVEPLPGYDGLSIGSSTSVGEPVWTIGYPLGESLNITSGRVKDYGTTSLISDTPIEQCSGPNMKVEQAQVWFFVMDVCVVTFKSIQTDLVIYGGNSGSPMLDIFGRVVGVVFAADSRTNWGRSVPLEDVNEFLKAY